MEEDDKKMKKTSEYQSVSLQNKILYAIIAIAVVLLAVILVAKIGYNIDLLNPASGKMSLAASLGNSAGARFENVSQPYRNQTNQSQQNVNVSPLQNVNKNFSFQSIMLQDKITDENRPFNGTSNIMKTKHDTVYNSINNVR